MSPAVPHFAGQEAGRINPPCFLAKARRGDKFGLISCVVYIILINIRLPNLCPHLKYNTKQMKNATSIIHKAYRTSVVIPKAALNNDLIFIFNEPTTYGTSVNVSCLGELIPPAFLRKQEGGISSDI